MLRRSQRRRMIRKLVSDRDIDGLLAWSDQDPDTAQRVIALVFERDDELRWHAIDALGQLAAHLAKRDGLERVRGLIRRLLWLMNDESGGIVWHGPEAIAEILANVPELVGEYGRIVASFIDEDPFGPGVHWAVARLASTAPEELAWIKDRLRLSSEHPEERAYGLVALAAFDRASAVEAARERVDDPEPLVSYDPATGTLTSTTVGVIARKVALLASDAA